jgi:cytochrome c oxidase cbb3-type subunit 3
MFVFLIILILTAVIFFAFHEKEPSFKKLNLSPFFSNIRQRLTASVPVEKEKDVLLDHDYDGITELDNQLPPWWKFLFYFTIVFAIVYMLYFHVFNIGNLQEEEYAAEVKQFEIQQTALQKTSVMINENTVTILTDAGSLFSGKEIFTKNCAACHGNYGEGLVGPNLTDDYWINGGSIKDIFKTIRDGVPEKGMISWKSQLNPKQMQEVGSYIKSLYGTNPPNAKPPQGEKYVEKADSLITM